VACELPYAVVVGVQLGISRVHTQQRHLRVGLQRCDVNMARASDSSYLCNSCAQVDVQNSVKKLCRLSRYPATSEFESGMRKLSSARVTVSQLDVSSVCISGTGRLDPTWCGLEGQLVQRWSQARSHVFVLVHHKFAVLHI
jgi:hypothetical protein